MLDKKISFPPHIMFQNFDDEAILLNIDTQEHFGLDSISSLFIQGLIDKRTPRQAASLILNEYNVSEEELEKDLNILINTLLENALIEIS